MKKLFAYLISAIMAAALLNSCSEDKSSNIFNDESSFINLSFSISTSDIKTRAIVDVDDDGSTAKGICWSDDIDDFPKNLNLDDYKA